nr:hypothetical protein CFP56_01951 [Quercus suber]
MPKSAVPQKLARRLGEERIANFVRSKKLRCRASSSTSVVIAPTSALIGRLIIGVVVTTIVVWPRCCVDSHSKGRIFNLQPSFNDYSSAFSMVASSSNPNFLLLVLMADPKALNSFGSPFDCNMKQLFII